MNEIIASTNHISFTAAEITILVILGIWELIWKGIALWKAGRNGQPAWFVAMLILNTVGILEIIYILFFQRKAGKKDA